MNKEDNYIPSVVKCFAAGLFGSLLCIIVIVIFFKVAKVVPNELQQKLFCLDSVPLIVSGIIALIFC